MRNISNLPLWKSSVKVFLTFGGTSPRIEANFCLFCLRSTDRYLKKELNKENTIMGVPGFSLIWSNIQETLGPSSFIPNDSGKRHTCLYLTSLSNTPTVFISPKVKLSRKEVRASFCFSVAGNRIVCLSFQATIA